MKALIFTAKGDYARFRCPYTTTSALTYTVIHPIAVKGLIGAIMGIDYKELYEYTKNMKVAIEVLNNIRKDTQSFNLIPQANNNGSATFPSRIEFLRDVSYRIYISDEDSKLEDIKEVLVNRSYTFTPYLGASEHIAKLEFETLKEIGSLSDKKGNITSVIPKENVIIDENEDVQLCIDRIPIMNEKSREYIKYEKIAFIPGSTVRGYLNNVVKVGEGNVYFF